MLDTIKEHLTSSERTTFLSVLIFLAMRPLVANDYEALQVIIEESRAIKERIKFECEKATAERNQLIANTDTQYYMFIPDQQLAELPERNIQMFNIAQYDKATGRLHLVSLEPATTPQYTPFLPKIETSRHSIPLNTEKPFSPIHQEDFSGICAFAEPFGYTILLCEKYELHGLVLLQAAQNIEQAIGNAQEDARYHTENSMPTATK